jgi:hypothetical protein
MLDAKDQLEIISQHVLAPTGDDTVMRGGFYEIASGPTYLMRVTEELWRSWSGRRFKDGEEHHGPVYVMGSNSLYTGSRTCKCNVCALNTISALKPN